MQRGVDAGEPRYLSRKVEFARRVDSCHINRYVVQAEPPMCVLHLQFHGDIEAIGEHVPIAGAIRIGLGGHRNGEQWPAHPLSIAPAAGNGRNGRIALCGALHHQALQQCQRDKKQEGDAG